MRGAVVVGTLSQALQPLRALRPSILLVACSTFSGMLILAPGAALADDWGCQVMLCLSNPGGPEQYAKCVPPVEKLWAALRHGDPFPVCDFGAGGSRGTSAANRFASAGYCREDLLYWGGPEQSELLCNARGAINVEIDGALYTRVWWDVRGTHRTLTEFYGAGTMQVPQVPYDPGQAARQFLEPESHARDGGEGGGQ
ncbi:hypothetical protein [Paraburkholderia sp. A2WS-5]|uniref:hypothetical protein n=1 Tax=Paraburkholderia sp. A2WS-5 TaxID=3028372 RepID=UPI003BA06CE3